VNPNLGPVSLAAVIAAAALHAGWNALVKVGRDPLISLTVISAFGGLAGAMAIQIVGLSERAALHWLSLGIVLHTAHRFFLARAYSEGDLGQVYPIARGTAPLIVTIVGLVLSASGSGPRSWRGSSP
jgi:multidrug transporter EmrE-like cation transporter